MSKTTKKRNNKKNNKKKSNKRRGSVLMTGGLLLLLGALLLTGYNLWTDKQAGDASEKVLEQLEEVMPDSAVGETANHSDRDARMPTKKIDGKRYIGKISIPSIDLKLPVLAKWKFDDLMIAPSVYSGSYYSDDLVIAGHNYSNHFRSLRWVDIGAKVTLKAVDGKRYRYVVNNIEVMEPTEAKRMIRSSDDWDLTLFTCTVGGQSRCAVRCVRTDNKKDKK